MTLVVVTTPEPVPGEREVTVQLFELGLLRLHLRRPNANIADIRTWLQGDPAEYHRRIRLHQTWDLALEFGLEGLHAGAKMQDAAGLAKAINILEQVPGLQLSLALHDPSRIPLLGPPYHEALLSPVFESLSKQGYQPN